MNQSRNQLRYKRILDLAILAVAHLFPPLLPIWLLLWTLIPIAIWLEDRGPVFFRQQRISKDGRLFNLLKFRTMIPGSEISGLVHLVSDLNTDSRVTRIGRLLRRTALDELPQIVNILRGDMSFVGPRAMPIELHENAVKEVPKFTKRLSMMPGLTGIAQLYLTRSCSPRQRLGYDLLYQRKASLWVDIRLISRSIWNTMTGSWGM